MSDTPSHGVPKTAQAPPSTPEEAAWGELRSLLFGPETILLEHLHQRVETFHVGPRDVSQVLAEAVQLRGSQDTQLTTALLPTVETALQVSVSRHPRVLVDILFPLLGPAIRKAIAVTLRGMFETLNRSLEISLSPRGLLWRLEALRTGTSFAEVVLLHTLRYRVEQVLLIHRETGLLLHHVVAAEVAVQDGAMVSGMLTAIRDFMHDSFGGAEEETLDTIEYGERTLWIEQGPYALLVGVVRGAAPRELKTVFQEALESIHFELQEALVAFAGDATPLEASHPALESCLQQQFATDTASRSSSRWGWILGAVLLLGLGGWGVLQFRAHQRWLACFQGLRAQPGTVVFEVEHRQGTYTVAGLLDPLAPDPLTVPAVTSLCAGMAVQGRWHTYYALHPQFVVARARHILAPPATVTLHLDEQGGLHATGEAPYQWALEAHKLVRLIPGVTQWLSADLAIPDHPKTLLARASAVLSPPETVSLRLEDSVLVISGAAPQAWITTVPSRVSTLPGIKGWREDKLTNLTRQALQTLKEDIEATTVRFYKGTVQPEEGQEPTLLRLTALLTRLLDVAAAADQRFQLEVLGHTDRSGSVAENLKLAQGRAEYVITALHAQGLSDLKMTAISAGWRQLARGEMTEEDRAINRRVSLRVIVTESAAEKG